MVEEHEPQAPKAIVDTIGKDRRDLDLRPQARRLLTPGRHQSSTPAVEDAPGRTLMEHIKAWMRSRNWVFNVQVSSIQPEGQTASFRSDELYSFDNSHGADFTRSFADCHWAVSCTPSTTYQNGCQSLLRPDRHMAR